MFKFELDQTVHFIMGNRVCSAPVLSRMWVENLHPDWNHTQKQSEVFTRFGPCRIVYATWYGELMENQLFANREALARAIVENKI